MTRDATAAVSRAVAAGPDGEAPGTILAGCSGGLDSTVLLHALAQAHPGRVRAVHVHHGLHADADAWASRCEAFCASLRVPLQVIRVTVVDVDAGPEAAARAARHRAFLDAMQPGDWLALAHHRDDQAETFLLRALRGAGPDGLASMRPLRPFGPGLMWRPLLDLPRADLLAYAQASDLRWIEDPSNASSDFDRNFLRNTVMPLLQQRWPQADAMFAQSARMNRQARTLLDAEDEAALARLRHGLPVDELDADALRVLPPERRARVLRRWMRQLGLPPLPAAALTRIEDEVLQARADAEPRVEWAGACIEGWKHRLRAGASSPALPPDWQAVWDGRAPLSLPEGSVLSLEGSAGFDTPLQVRARMGGERIDLPHRTHSHALKHVLQDAWMPPWIRRRLPLLVDADSGQLIAAGTMLSRHFAGRAQAPDARLHWHLA
ncbi:tRNA lysidine(34) synthetase TilS [Lysobacter oculi]|uniref:tRNA(Ile)-lysidine synthase n=1 Tax=Solilutibacter oculi TaxID=2698682 RepID=A0A344J5R3_9GAMM|nr:tRNA lysidine(34) synthetase TilS [Lysobacter oculi]AXA84373.1 tRNA lysidine(34) synthetase TilS [Lysobacter oculi]